VINFTYNPVGDDIMLESFQLSKKKHHLVRRYGYHKKSIYQIEMRKPVKGYSVLTRDITMKK
jgi:hypothetical protein